MENKKIIITKFTLLPIKEYTDYESYEYEICNDCPKEVKLELRKKLQEYMTKFHKDSEKVMILEGIITVKTDDYIYTCNGNSIKRVQRKENEIQKQYGYLGCSHYKNTHSAFIIQHLELLLRPYDPSFFGEHHITIKKKIEEEI